MCVSMCGCVSANNEHYLLSRYLNWITSERNGHQIFNEWRIRRKEQPNNNKKTKKLRSHIGIISKWFRWCHFMIICATIWKHTRTNKIHEKYESNKIDTDTLTHTRVNTRTGVLSTARGSHHGIRKGSHYITYSVHTFAHLSFGKCAQRMREKLNVFVYVCDVVCVRIHNF